MPQPEAVEAALAATAGNTRATAASEAAALPGPERMLRCRALIDEQNFLSRLGMDFWDVETRLTA